MYVIHGCSRVDIDPRIPTMPRPRTSGFTVQADIACTERESPSGVLTGRTKGQLRPDSNCLRGELYCMWMTASNELGAGGGHAEMARQ